MRLTGSRLAQTPAGTELFVDLPVGEQGRFARLSMPADLAAAEADSLSSQIRAFASELYEIARQEQGRKG